MSNLTDDMLNDYIDNQLDSNSVNKLNRTIIEDPDTLKKLKALKSVDRSLREIPVTPAPEGFTAKLMNRILAHSKSVVPKINYFFISMISLLSVAIFAIMIVALSVIDKPAEGSGRLSFLDYLLTWLRDNTPKLLGFFTNSNVTTIGLLLSLILLTSGYYVLESHKEFKNKLKNLS
ncbi:MAG TPA: hypothetical protein PLZ15_00725 [Melioribacteraceae bacterium]|nr:hypothetical protein [Melioribacteraceae bacterium]